MCLILFIYKHCAIKVWQLGQCNKDTTPATRSQLHEMPAVPAAPIYRRSLLVARVTLSRVHLRLLYSP